MLKVNDLIENEVYKYNYTEYYLIGRCCNKGTREVSTYLQKYYKHSKETDSYSRTYNNCTRSQSWEIPSKEDLEHFLLCEKAGKYIKPPVCLINEFNLF